MKDTSWLTEIIETLDENVANYVLSDGIGLDGDHRWTLLINTPISKEDKKMVLEVFATRRIMLREDVDEQIWTGSKSGSYSIKLGFKIQSTPKKLCWDKSLLPKVSAFLWTTMHQRILTSDQQRTIGIEGSSFYTMCMSDAESANHLLFKCKVAYQCWDWLMRVTG
ncbi:hypothetical protein SUGI_0525180 [Cryptomeria japonica]|nr:hypothetical protein SUGI_0525180 [Cryptomeria japonica]